MAKPSIKHPFAAIEHRVIDSQAYADLTFSARSLLCLLVRQLTVNSTWPKGNNGHLNAAFSYMGRYGFSANTLTRAIDELVLHGFVFRTKRGGYHSGFAKFAVTWLEVKDTAGIAMQGFKPCAWRDWQPDEKKLRPPKLGACNRKNGELSPPTIAKMGTTPPPKSEHYVLVPANGEYSRVSQRRQHPLAIRLTATMDRGASRIIQ